MPRKERHTKRRDAVVARMMKGEVLCVETSAADGAAWWLEPSGRSVGPVTARRVIALPTIHEGSDGLLEDSSQTYRYVNPK